MRGWTHFFSEGEAQLEALQAVSVDQTDVELKHVGQQVFRYIPTEEYPHFLPRVGAIVNLDDFDKASQLQLGLTAESLEMDLQPLADAVDLLELGEEGQSELRLLNDADEEL